MIDPDKVDHERLAETEWEVEQLIRQAFDSVDRDRAIVEAAYEILEYVVSIFRPDLMKQESLPEPDSTEEEF